MRTFDETGKEFLANYIGKDYAASLSSISERHAVLFGKASSCENPILGTSENLQLSYFMLMMRLVSGLI